MCQYVECHLLILILLPPLLLMPLVECWCMHIHIAWEGQVEWTTRHHLNVALCVIP